MGEFDVGECGVLDSVRAEHPMKKKSQESIFVRFSIPLQQVTHHTFLLRLKSSRMAISGVITCSDSDWRRRILLEFFIDTLRARRESLRKSIY